MACQDGDVYPCTYENLQTIIQISLGGNCHHNCGGSFLRRISSLSTMSDEKIRYLHAVFLWSTSIMELPCWKEPFSLIAGDALVSTLSAGGRKLRLKCLPTASPYKTRLKSILSLLTDWPSYIDTFHDPGEGVRVCLFNSTGKLFKPEILYCFWNSILCLNISRFV